MEQTYFFKKKIFFESGGIFFLKELYKVFLRFAHLSDPIGKELAGFLVKSNNLLIPGLA